MKFNEVTDLIGSDLIRYGNRVSIKQFFKRFFLSAGFNYSVKMRLCNYFRYSKYLKILFPLSYLVYRHAMHKFGISIPYSTQIGKGLYIGHSGGIVVNSKAIIGNNVNISHGVTIGKSGRGEKSGVPIIGNNCYLGPGSVIIGKIKISNNVAIGANAVVTKNVPENAVIVGVPGKIISMDGAERLINNKAN